GKYSVKFTKLTGAPEREGEEFAVETECMGHISLEEVARSRGGIEKLAESIVQEVAKEIVAVKREEYYRKTLIEARDRFADQLISELVRDGLLMKLDDGVYGVNVNRVFSLVGGNLAKAYANPKLYGSPDMFSPPSERKSHVLRLELTQGCDYNQCTYCGGYKGIPYREKSYEEFVAHYKEVKAVVGRYNIGGIRRVFIGGGNALSVDFKTLLKVVQFIEDEVEPRRIAIYGRADSILKKGRERLERLEEAGLGLIYWGVESGSQAVLNYVRKKVKADQMFRAGHIAYDADLQLSVMVMPGLGGMKHAESHIEQTAEFLNSVNIRFVTFMAVNPPKKSRYAQIMAQEMADGKNRPLTDREVVEQLKEILTRMEPGYQKVGMFGCGIDQVGRNPVRFNVAFDSDGKREALAVCKRYLKKATA
ncbi:MAG: radical SAM protein, partial [Candidatus Micrarchaeota archaeon]|nr:radical SAM protein [Candidatus Micrarchaeota archaeon]